MRRLITGDLFAAIRAVKKANIREQIKDTLKSANKNDLEDAGMDIVFTILECVGDERGENAIYEFLSAPFEMTAEEVKKLPLVDFRNCLKELEEENDLKSFFKQLSDLMSTK